MSQPSRRQTVSSTTVALLRALSALGPRLHEQLSAKPAALNTIVCDTLRTYGLFAHIAERDDQGTLRVVATSPDAATQAFIEDMLQAPLIGYPIPAAGPYAAVLAGEASMLVERVVDVLEPITPQLTTEQRETLACRASADRAVLAPLIARGRVTGVLTVWGPRTRLSRDDVPAVEALAAHVGIAMENAHQDLLERQSYAALHVILRIAEVATAPATSADPATRLVATAQALSALEAVDFVHAILVDEPASHLVPLCMFGVPPAIEMLWKSEVRSVSLDAIPHVRELLAALHAGQILRQQLKEEPPLLAPRTTRELNVRAGITAPVLDEDRLLGLLAIGRVRLPDPASVTIFAPWDEELLSGTARLIGQALTRGRLAVELSAAETARLAAEEAARQRDVFLSIASHELRTPLTSMKALLQLARRRLAESPAGERTAEDLERGTSQRRGTGSSIADLLARMDRQEERLIRLVDDLLETSRIDTGHLELHLEYCDLATLVRQVVDEQRQIAPQRHIALLTPSTILRVHADVDRIQQVIANFLTNALKYSPADQPIEVTLRTQDRQACLSVRDHGPGVPESERELIWQRFHRVPGVEVLSGSGIGLGIGLYISKTFVERHSGTVDVISAPGGGAIFSFCLPLAEE
jgi:signal transduction histidine kinase